MKPGRPRYCLYSSRHSSFEKSLKKTLRLFSINVETALKYDDNMLDSDGVIFICATGYDTEGILQGFHELLPFFLGTYQGNLLIVSNENSLSRDGSIEKILDSRVTYIPIPRSPSALPEIVSGLLAEPSPADISARKTCCSRLRVRFGRPLQLLEGLEGLKTWYDEERIDELLEIARSRRSFDLIEHDILNKAPWLRKLGTGSIPPAPVIVGPIPHSLGILVIDDEEHYYRLISRALSTAVEAENRKWKTYHARNKQEALGKITKYLSAEIIDDPIDIVLLDMKFGDDPDEGLRILKEIRKLTKSIPVIMLTVSTGTNVKIIDCIEKGANFYATKAELENLPAYITHLIKAASKPIIDDDHPDIKLNECDRYLLTHLCRKNENILISPNNWDFSSRALSKKIFQVRRHAVFAVEGCDDGQAQELRQEQVPIIVKIGESSKLASEYDNYKKYIEPYLPHSAAKVERYFKHGDMAALSYVKVDQASQDLEKGTVTSLYDSIENFDEENISNIIVNLKSFIARDIGTAWYKKTSTLPPSTRMRVMHHYAFAMPSVLHLSKADAQAPAKTIGSIAALTEIDVGDLIKIAGKLIEEKRLSKNSGEGTGFHRTYSLEIFDTKFRIRLDDRTAIKAVKNSDGTHTVAAKVSDTLTEMLQREWKEAVEGGRQCRGVEEPLFAYIEEVNPISNIWRVLFEPLYGNISVIHGDFHMNNIFFDLASKYGKLIDYGCSTIGHVCFDFIRLETDIRTRLIAKYFKKYAGTVLDMFIFEQSLHPWDNNTPLFIENHELWRKLKEARRLINELRKLASSYLSVPDSWREYFQGLFCYSLKSFKFQKEKSDKELYPQSRYLPMACAVVSLQKGLKHSNIGQPVRAVLFDLWKTLLKGAGNPLTNYLKNKISASDLADLRKTLQTEDLSLEKTIDLVKKYDPDFNRETLAGIMATGDDDNLPVLQDGVESLIEDLNRCGVKVGIISNDWSLEKDRIKKVMRKAGMWDWLSVKIFSFQEGSTKPSPELFQNALKGLNKGIAPAQPVITARQVYMVGDSYGYDILPARNLGMRTFHVKEKDWPQRFRDVLRQDFSCRSTRSFTEKL